MTVSRGLEGVVANTTRLSDVIGDKGQLVYCGYDINELAGKVSYKEVDLPSLERQTAESRGIGSVYTCFTRRAPVAWWRDRFH